MTSRWSDNMVKSTLGVPIIVFFFFFWQHIVFILCLIDPIEAIRILNVIQKKINIDFTKDFLKFVLPIYILLFYLISQLIRFNFHLLDLAWVGTIPHSFPWLLKHTSLLIRTDWILQKVILSNTHSVSVNAVTVNSLLSKGLSIRLATRWKAISVDLSGPLRGVFTKKVNKHFIHIKAN